MVTRESRGGGLKQKRREESLLHLSVYLQTLGGFVMVSLRPSERSSWENLATEREKRVGEEEEVEGEKRQGGKVHPVDGSPGVLRGGDAA